MSRPDFADIVYAGLLWLYPRDFRGRFGAEMLQDFRRLRRHGFRPLTTARLYIDVICTATLEQSRGLHPAVFAVCLLLLASHLLHPWSQQRSLAVRIRAAAREEGIGPDTALAFIWVESRFDTTAVSRHGAIGLTQMMLATAQRLDPNASAEKLEDGEYNLHLGLRHLRMLRDEYGDMREALRVYNAGPDYMKSAFAAARSQEYATRVLRAVKPG